MSKPAKKKSPERVQTNDMPADRAPAAPAQPAKHTCFHCVFAHWVQPGVSALFPNGWMSRLMCVNCDRSPGEMCEVWPASMCTNFRARREPPVRLEEPAPPSDEIRYIALTQGKFAIVDAADYEWLSQYKWHLVAPGKLYAGRKEGGKTIYMHREIMQPPPGMMVDHIDGNGLHNRRANMRNCTNQQNMRNIHKRRSGASIYKGVYYDKRRHTWYARICHNGKNIHLGTFPTEIEAAHAYDRAARRLFGEFAHLNFPDEVQTSPVARDPSPVPPKAA